MLSLAEVVDPVLLNFHFKFSFLSFFIFSAQQRRLDLLRRQHRRGEGEDLELDRRPFEVRPAVVRGRHLDRKRDQSSGRCRLQRTARPRGRAKSLFGPNCILGTHPLCQNLMPPLKPTLKNQFTFPESDVLFK